MYKVIAALALMLNQGSAAYLENDHKVKDLTSLRYIDDLLASGSGQFSDDQLAILLNDIVQRRNIHPSKIVVIDLRQESHLFANGIPFTITGHSENTAKDYTSKNEKAIQTQLRTEKNIVLEPRKIKKEDGLKKDSRKIRKSVQLESAIIKTEEELCKNYGVQYWRLPVTANSEKAAINEFIKFTSSLPKDTWIHIHCRGGEARTTAFLAILEMMRFKNHSLYNILTRQHQVGGNDLLKMPSQAERQQAVRDRLDVIRNTFDELH